MNTLGTLQRFPDLIQGTEEWLAQRRGIVTASVVNKLITGKTLKPANNPESRGLTAQLVAERITSHIDPTYVSDDMLRGTEDEPRARDLYSKHYAPVTEVGFMIRTIDGCQLGYSPDGLVGSDGLIEVKSRRQKKQLQTILDDTVPAENMAQLQAGLLVSGRQWIDYVSYCGGMPLYVKRVTPNTQWFTAITEAVAAFEQAAKEMIATYHKAAARFPATERIDYELEIVL